MLTHKKTCPKHCFVFVMPWAPLFFDHTHLDTPRFPQTYTRYSWLFTKSTRTYKTSKPNPQSSPPTLTTKCKKHFYYPRDFSIHSNSAASLTPRLPPLDLVPMSFLQHPDHSSPSTPNLRLLTFPIAYSGAMANATKFPTGCLASRSALICAVIIPTNTRHGANAGAN